MTTYIAPLQDVLYSMTDVHGFIDHYKNVVPDAGLDEETIASILEAIAKFSEQVLSPLNLSGDQEGAHWENGKVIVPSGFKDAYRRFVDDGWPAFAQSVEHGGQGLPYSLHMAGSEFLQGANQSWCMYAMLNDGAIKTLISGAKPELLDRLLPNLVSGNWGATMCLTEAQAGSDLGLLTTRAEPIGNGRFRITGNKIFISSGDHDLTPNIVHLVLARLPNAPPGVRGISLFVVSKRHIEVDGSLGELNNVNCISIEHKMGLKASATCSMAFDGAEGWLVGQPHRGLASMFIFINKSRLGVAIQSVAQAQAAFAESLSYARERLQGRAIGATTNELASPLTSHADVRRMLMTQKSIAEGGRSLLHYCARLVDVVDSASGKQMEKERAGHLLSLLTPIAKACMSELSFEAVDLGIQILGGHGFIKEWGMEQRLRDVRVTRIYEGTTGIQAMDLLGRKVLTDALPLQVFSQEILDWCGTSSTLSLCADLKQRMKATVNTWLALTSDLVIRNQSDPSLVGAIAVDYLMLSGYVTLAYMWVRAADVSCNSEPDTPFHASKLITAEFYFETILPRMHTHLALIQAGNNVVLKMDPELI